MSMSSVPCINARRSSSSDLRAGIRPQYAGARVGCQPEGLVLLFGGGLQVGESRFKFLPDQFVHAEDKAHHLGKVRLRAVEGPSDFGCSAVGFQRERRD